jgi:hypothetical protein
MSWQLEPVSFHDLSRIQYQAHICRFGPDDDGALVLAFIGEMPPGSAGNDDATFMSFIAGKFVALTLPDCVVFDFRELTYSFGNSLGELPHAVHMQLPEMPIVLVISEKCCDGIATLFKGAASKGLLFSDLDDALARARDLACVFARDW